jgi:hypothetical protein
MALPDLVDNGLAEAGRKRLAKAIEAAALAAGLLERGSLPLSEDHLVRLCGSLGDIAAQHRPFNERRRMAYVLTPPMPDIHSAQIRLSVAPPETADSYPAVVVNIDRHVLNEMYDHMLRMRSLMSQLSYASIPVEAYTDGDGSHQAGTLLKNVTIRRARIELTGTGHWQFQGRYVPETVHGDGVAADIVSPAMGFDDLIDALHVSATLDLSGRPAAIETIENDMEGYRP